MLLQGIIAIAASQQLRQKFLMRRLNWSTHSSVQSVEEGPHIRSQYQAAERLEPTRLFRHLLRNQPLRGSRSRIKNQLARKMYSPRAESFPNC